MACHRVLHVGRSGRGVIASSLTQTVGVSSKEFLGKQIGPWTGNLIHFRARYWTYIEHTSFWIGLLCAVGSFVRMPNKPASSGEDPSWIETT
jgi:hypothetical protein